MKNKIKHKILVIDDEVAFLFAIEAKLSHEGFEVDTTTTAEEGLKKIEDKPDIILLDLLLPKMNGFEFLEIVKKDPKTKDIPVIIISNYGAKNNVERGLKLGAIDFIVKLQYSLEEVVEKIKSAIFKTVK